MRTKKLSLRREPLAELASHELTAVAAGQALTHATCGLTDGCTHGPSFDERCPTTPINRCLSLDGSCPR